MATPTSRDRTYAAGSQLKSADLNRWQDLLIQYLKGDLGAANELEDLLQLTLSNGGNGVRLEVNNADELNIRTAADDGEGNILCKAIAALSVALTNGANGAKLEVNNADEINVRNAADTADGDLLCAAITAASLKNGGNTLLSFASTYILVRQNLLANANESLGTAGSPFGDLHLSGDAKVGGVTDAQGQLKRTGVISPAAIEGAQNDYNPSGLSGASVIRLANNTGGGADYLTGLAGGADGRIITIIAITAAGGFSINDEDTNSTAANRFRLPSGTDLTVPPYGAATFRYDGTDSRWYLISKTF